MAIFYNQATLTYGNVIKNSNITEGEIISGISIDKTAITSEYESGSQIAYVITLTNNGATDATGVTLTDDLGAFIIPDTDDTVIPLSYVEGSLLYYINGTLQPTPELDANGTLVIEGITVPAGGNATVIYAVTANECAPLSAGSTITNTVTVGGACDEISASATVNVREYFDLSIAKAVCPAVLLECGEVTYTFIIQNNGNIAVVATDDVIVRDTFDSILHDITVTLNGEELEAGTGYTYNEENGEFATVAGAITVPAATFVRADEACSIITTPGVAILTVSGSL